MDEFTPQFATLNEIYERNIHAYADRPLFGTKRDNGWEWTSYAEFGEKVDRLRSGLAQLGVTVGTTVGLISDNREEWAVTAYAAYGLGGAVVPMYEAQSDDNWRHIIADSGAELVVVSTGAIRNRVRSFRDAVSTPFRIVVMDDDGDDESVTFDELYELGKDKAVPVAEVDPEHLAGFIYTSGTTGNPKGVLLTHRNLASNVSAVTSVFPLVPEDRSVSFLPWAHAFGQTVELHALFSVGASTAFAQSVRTLVDDIREVQPTMLVSVPRIFNRIYDQVNQAAASRGRASRWLFGQAIANQSKRRSLAAAGRSSNVANAKHQALDRLVLSGIRGRFGGRLKYAFSGGAAIADEVAEFIDALGIVVYEGYGLSETSPIVTANWPGSRKLGSVGRPVPGVRVEIDETVGADGGEGEIVVFGHCVMRGYHNLPAENAHALTADGGFRTGDIGHVDSDGFLYITGRVKEQYKLENGKYVVPGRIEEKIMLSPYVANAMVYGMNKPHNIALVVIDEPAVRRWASDTEVELGDLKLGTHPLVRELIANEVRTRCSDVARYAVPQSLVVLDEDFTTDNGLLTPTLKVRRKAVVDRYQGDLDAAYAE